MQKIKISDTGIKQKITLKSQTNTPSHYKIKGLIDGVSDISILTKDKVYIKERIMDRVSLTLEGDWYDKEMILLYEPIKPVVGELTIYYNL